MIQFPNGQQATADQFPSLGTPNACTLGPSSFSRGLVFNSFNALCDLQLFYRDDTGQNPRPADALLGVAPITQLFPGAIGFVARSHVPGVPAAITGYIWEVSDGPLPEVPIPITGTLTPSGTITPTTPGMQLIQKNDLTVSGIFSSIPSSFTNLALELAVRSAAAGGSDILNLQFNGDNGPNYEWAATEGTAAGAVSSTGGGGVNSIQLQGVPAAGSNAGRAAFIRVDLPFYSAAVLDKGAIYSYPSQDGVNVYTIQGGGQWRSNAVLASIALNLSTGPYAAGSSAALYGF